MYTMSPYSSKSMVINPYVISTTLRGNDVLINTQTGRLIFLNEAGKKVFEQVSRATSFNIRLVAK